MSTSHVSHHLMIARGSRLSGIRRALDLGARELNCQTGKPVQEEPATRHPSATSAARRTPYFSIRAPSTGSPSPVLGVVQRSNVALAPPRTAGRRSPSPGWASVGRGRGTFKLRTRPWLEEGCAR
ncbi:hypothetical protein BO71DRAFT_426522 [Aspergillus ellipticus CBS 707.79]|uniref:Uncharacterized protein n=1 Tax=Aspergillus ellipticus CBS 707.79 TaxID=1448320 RepID=A0A319DKQ9_9EURO|nr:hypothetical protein BO71DRAFT_426522 [Aspergillus ellipticus CBS 707.79]